MRGTERHLCRAAFTLVEMLTVIAVVGILAAILIPTTSAVRRSAQRAKTKVLFTQWATAMEQFRREYGYFPGVTTADHLVDATSFFAALTGRDFAGTELAGPALNGNKRRLAFLAIADADQLKDLAGQLDNGLVDAFGNSDIVILTDADGDGFVRPGELVRTAVRPGNRHLGYGAGIVPDATDFPPAGIRAPVLVYSAGRGRGPEDLVYSWK